MHRTPVFLVIASADLRQPSAAMNRAVELARLSGGTLSVCGFVSDSLLDAVSARTPPALAERVRRDLLSEQSQKLKKLAGQLPIAPEQIQIEALWSPVTHETILAKAIQIDADLVLKDVQVESVLCRAMFTPLDWKLIRLLACDLMLVNPASPARPQRVLAAVDVLEDDSDHAAGDLNQRIIDSARRLAAQTGARLELASVAPWERRGNTESPSAGALMDSIVTEHLQAFRHFAEEHQIPAAHRHRVLGTPTEALVHLADEIGADVTVIGNVHRNTMERLFLGSTAELLLQRLKSDLLVVKPKNFLKMASRYVDLDRIRGLLNKDESPNLNGQALVPH